MPQSNQYSKHHNDSTKVAPYAKQQLTAMHWWLLGTKGCHLCDDAENLLRLFSKVKPLTYENIDICEFDDAMMSNFAPFIPILITPHHQFLYPFSILELHSITV